MSSEENTIRVRGKGGKVMQWPIPADRPEGSVEALTIVVYDALQAAQGAGYHWQPSQSWIDMAFLELRKYRTVRRIDGKATYVIDKDACRRGFEETIVPSLLETLKKTDEAFRGVGLNLETGEWEPGYEPKIPTLGSTPQKKTTSSAGGSKAASATRSGTKKPDRPSEAVVVRKPASVVPYHKPQPAPIGRTQTRRPKPWKRSWGDWWLEDQQFILQIATGIGIVAVGLLYPWIASVTGIASWMSPGWTRAIMWIVAGGGGLVVLVTGFTYINHLVAGDRNRRSRHKSEHQTLARNVRAFFEKQTRYVELLRMTAPEWQRWARDNNREIRDEWPKVFDEWAALGPSRPEFRYAGQDWLGEAEEMGAKLAATWMRRVEVYSWAVYQDTPEGRQARRAEVDGHVKLTRSDYDRVVAGLGVLKEIADALGLEQAVFDKHLRRGDA